MVPPILCKEVEQIEYIYPYLILISYSCLCPPYQNVWLQKILYNIVT